MWGLRSIDPVASTLSASSLTLAQQDRAELTRVSKLLDELYEGEQVGEYLRWLYSVTEDADIRSVYSKLATTLNATKLVIDRVSTLAGVRVVWLRAGDSRPHAEAQKLWDYILERRLPGCWSDFWRSVDRSVNLLMSGVVTCGWNAWAEKLDLSWRGPHEITVDYAPGNPSKLDPDEYRFIREEASGWYERWVFGDETGRLARGRWEHSDGDSGEFVVRDPDTGRALIPCVAFRVRTDDDYFVWNGQHDLLTAQQFVNQAWTKIRVLIEYAAHKQLIRSGPGWVDEEGRASKVLFETVKAVNMPQAVLGREPDLKWLGAQVHEEIGVLLNAVGSYMQQLCGVHGIQASVIRAANDPMSGQSLQILDAELRKKARADADRLHHGISEVVRCMRLIWDHHQPGRAFPADAVPNVLITDASMASIPADEVSSDISLVNAGLKRRLATIFKVEPNIPPQLAYEMAGLTDDGAAPAATAVADVQTQALNGAQIASIQTAIQAVADRQLPADSVIALIRLAVPTLSEDQAAALVEPAATFEKPAPPAEAGASINASAVPARQTGSGVPSTEE